MTSELGIENQPIGTDSALVDSLAKANVANIRKKLKAGKTLTAAERRALEDLDQKQSGSEWVKDLPTLARELGLEVSVCGTKADGKPF